VMKTADESWSESWGDRFLRFEVQTAVTVKKTVLWNVRVEQWQSLFHHDDRHNSFLGNYHTFLSDCTVMSKKVVLPVVLLLWTFTGFGTKRMGRVVICYSETPKLFIKLLCVYVCIYVKFKDASDYVRIQHITEQWLYGWNMGLRPLACCDCGFISHREAWMSVVIIVCC
jgi:hypothetical protein